MMSVIYVISVIFAFLVHLLGEKTALKYVMLLHSNGNIGFTECHLTLIFSNENIIDI